MMAFVVIQHETGAMYTHLCQNTYGVLAGKLITCTNAQFAQRIIMVPTIAMHAESEYKSNQDLIDGSSTAVTS